MAAKIRHWLDRDGRYYARVTVPSELRKIVGRRELLRPLGADRREAMRQHPAAVAELLRIIDDARAQAGAKPVVQDLPAPVLAHLRYRETVALDAEARAMHHSWARVGISDQYVADLKRVISGAASDDEMRETVGDVLDEFADRGLMRLPSGSRAWREASIWIARGELEALRRMHERDEGVTVPEIGDAEVLSAELPTKHEVLAVTLSGLVNGYFKAQERDGRGIAARKRWKPVYTDLIAFLGHEDATRVSRQDLLRWKEQLAERLNAKTIGDVYMAAVKAVLAWGLDSGRLTENVATGIKVRKAKRTTNRELGYNNAEAMAVLQASRRYRPAASTNKANREGEPITRAKNWIPLLAAHTGARVTELSQLRCQDVRTDSNGTHYIRITPDAGSVKTGRYRDVPLHPQIIEEGFLAVVEAVGSGPLFYSRSAENTSKRLASWITGLNLAEVAPNHGWRHRLKTIGREHGIEERVLDAIQGHAAGSAGANYGHVSMRTMFEAINRFPPIDL